MGRTPYTHTHTHLTTELLATWIHKFTILMMNYGNNFEVHVHLSDYKYPPAQYLSGSISEEARADCLLNLSHALSA